MRWEHMTHDRGLTTTVYHIATFIYPGRFPQNYQIDLNSKRQWICYEMVCLNETFALKLLYNDPCSLPPAFPLIRVQPNSAENNNNMFYILQDSPKKFIRTHTTLPRAALEKAEEVMRMYMSLMIQSDKPVDWNCEEEYTEDYPESTTEPLSQTTGSTTSPAII